MMQKAQRLIQSPWLPLVWLGAGTAWFIHHGWQAIHDPSPTATPGYFVWFRYLERLTPGWIVGLLLAAALLSAAGWVIWRQTCFDRWLLLAGALGLLGLAFLRPRSNGLGLALAVIFAFVTFAAGRWVLRRLGLTADSTPALLFFAWFSGCGVMVMIAMTLGFARLLSVQSFGLVLAVLALALRHDLRWLAQALWTWRPDLPAGSGPRLMALTLALFALLDLIGALAPTAAFDANWYHIFLPQQYLQSGGLDFFPTHYRSLWFSNVEMLNLWGLALAGEQLAQLIGFGLTLLLLLGVFVAMQEAFGRDTALLAALLLFTTPDIATYAPSAYVDIPMGLFLLGAGLAWLRWQRTEQTGWLLISALGVGLAAGTKLIGWPYLALFAALTALRLLRRPDRRAWRILGAAALVATLPSIPWLARAWLLGGDPIFPFGFRWFAETAWNRCADLLHSAHFAHVGVGQVRTLYGLGIALNFVALYASGIWLSLMWPLALWQLLRGDFGAQRRLALRLMTTGALLTVFQAILFPMPRFFVIAQVVGALTAAAGTWALMTQGPALARRVSVLLLVFVTALGLAHAVTARFDAPRAVFGLESATASLSRGLPEYAAIDWANHNLPADAHVLTWSLRSSFLHRTQTPVDPAFQGQLDYGRLTDAQQFLSRLHELGVTHLLVLPDASQFFYPQRYEVAAHLDTFLAAAADRLTLLHEQNGTRVYAIETAGAITPVPLPGIALCR